MSAKSTARDKFSHSATSMDKGRGGPRKGGAGGKGAWGKLGDELNAPAVLDKNDPNYDSEEDNDYVYVPMAAEEAKPEQKVQKKFTASIQAMNTFKKAVRAATEEFLVSADREEFTRCVKDLNMTLYHQEIPKVVVLSVLDKSDDAHKKASQLLQYIYQHQLVTDAQMKQGFLSVFNRINDLVLDIPNAEQLLTVIVNKAVVAEYLPEAFGKELVESAKLMRDADATRKAKKQISELWDEYFSSADLAEAATAIEELKMPYFHYEIVKQGVSKSMDMSSKERELASYLISALCGDLIASAQVEKGFEVLLQRVEDLYHDVPMVLHFLSCFVARAVADEALPPAFLGRVNLLETDMGTQVVTQADILLKKQHAHARLAQVWGPGDGRAVPEIKRAVRQLVKEYLDSGDLAEAEKCVKDLEAPYYNHEVVKRVVAAVVDAKDEAIEKAIKLLQTLRAHDVVSPTQLRMGLRRVQEALPDLKLDAPNAPDVVEKILTSLK